MPVHLAKPVVEEDTFVEPPAKQKYPWSRPRKSEVIDEFDFRFDEYFILNIDILGILCCKDQKPQIDLLIIAYYYD